MSEFFVTGLFVIIILGFATAFVLLGILYLHTALEEHQEGRHRTAFWGFGILGCIWLLVVVFGIGAAVTATVGAS